LGLHAHGGCGILYDEGTATGHHRQGEEKRCMQNDLGALTLLGESADWLKDARGKSIRDHRLAFVEAYRAAWEKPTDRGLHETLRRSVLPLFEALRHNHLYPDEQLLRPPDQGPAAYLPDPEAPGEDLDALRPTLVVNKFGIGEAPLLYLIYLLCGMAHRDAEYDLILEKKVGDILFLREPLFRADNLGVFSAEAMGRYHAVRILRGMKSVGLLDNKPIGQIPAERQREMRKIMTDPLRAAAAGCIQRAHHLPFVILDTATALEAYSHAHAAGRPPRDEREPRELFSRLKRHARRLDRHAEIGPDRSQRLMNLAVAAVVRSLAHVEAKLGERMYAFLRSERHKQRVRHARMFALLPNAGERLRFLNFLYFRSSRNPMYYVERFKEMFPEGSLRFVSKGVGFSVEPEETG
jgi:hypothetical protein